MKKKIFSLLLALLLMGSVAMPASAALTAERVTILFTHDLHSHLQPANDEKGVSYGGYARLKTVIDAQKELAPDAVLLDGGDFSMGSLFQTVYATDASELRVMGALGYDVTTFGNHEYDYRAAGLASMLNAAVDSGEPLPQIVSANYQPPKAGEEGYTADSQAVWDAFDRYGVKEYTVLERNGVNIAVFGSFGFDADSCSPMSGMILQDPIATAQRIVDQIEAEVSEPRMVVCLSHGGVWDDPEKSEDELLAAGVNGIDLIVSGHTHTTLNSPIQVNDTYIVSCGEYSKNLGVVTLELSGGEVSLYDYRLLPVNDTVAEDAEILAKVEQYKGLVEKSYLSQFGDWTYDTVLGYNPHEFGSQNDLSIHREAPLGNLIADSYRYAVQQAEGEDYIPVDFTVTANGVIRESLAQGDLTVADVFNVESLGIGADGVAGYPLVSVWITGRDLKNAFEVDASVVPLIPWAQLHISGMSFTYNPHRMIFNKVVDCAQVLPDGTRVAIEDDKLYRVVTGLYCGQMLGAVNDQSFGILEITPRDEQGNPITDLEAHILHHKDGREVKEWYAIASYIESMGTISDLYAGTDGRKVVDNSLSPIALLKNANWITMVVLVVVLVLILLVVLIVRVIVRKVKKNKK